MAESNASGVDSNRTAPSWEAPRWLRTTFLVLLGVAIIGAIVWALRPQPVHVDLAAVERGELEVAVEEDGRTRVRDRHTVLAPVSGTLRRIEWEAGDRVEAGEVLARIDGPEAGVPDARTEAQLRTRFEAARAGVERARAMVEVAEAGLVEARDEVRRQEILQGTGGGSESALARARAMLSAREAELRSARFGVQAAEGEVEDLRLALQRPTATGAEPLTLRAPVTGTVLRVTRESGGAVAPGEVLMEVGEPAALEAVVDLLSADAVRVPDGALAFLTRWGGDEELEARVRRVEPSGFTRVSALGIEEQRVNVILEPVGNGPGWARLGDGFRVEARIVLERADDVLRAPAGAVFRLGEGWAVFRATDGRLEEVLVEVGRRTPAWIEILSGLEEGDRVVVYPGDRAADGARFTERR
jgi:HlyD family secretion protein